MFVAPRLVLLVLSILCLSFPAYAGNGGGWGFGSGCHCPSHYSPVCDVHGKTHNNSCFASCKGKPIECYKACPCRPPSRTPTPTRTPRPTRTPKPTRSPRPPVCIPKGHPCSSTSRCCPCHDGSAVKCWGGRCTCPSKKNGKKAKKAKKEKKKEDSKKKKNKGKDGGKNGGKKGKGSKKGKDRGY